jgi:hypothetical protein
VKTVELEKLRTPEPEEPADAKGPSESISLQGSAPEGQAQMAAQAARRQRGQETGRLEGGGKTQSQGARIMATPVTLVNEAGKAVTSTDPLPTQASIAIAGTNLALGQAAMAASLPVAIASNQSPINVADATVNITVSVTLTVGATYATGDFVGTSTTPISFANAVRTSGGSATLRVGHDLGPGGVNRGGAGTVAVQRNRGAAGRQRGMGAIGC